MLNQIRDEKITKALPVARYLAKPAHLLPVRIGAYWAIAELDENPANELAEAIGREENLLLQLNLLRMLAERDNAEAHLTGLAMVEGTVGKVAAFEVARLGNGEALPAALAAVAEEGHPVVIDYVLNRFRQDSQADKPAAEAYVPPLLAYLSDLKLTRNRMTPNHDRGAAVVEMLANHGSHAAMAGLSKLLEGTDNSSRRQLVAGALYRSTNAGAVDLVRPLLDSAYSELYTYAALVIARHGGDAAIPVLLRIQDHKDITRPDVLVLANWYLIKLSGMTAPSVNAIVAEIQ
jgi:HEAT repeat protein